MARIDNDRTKGLAEPFLILAHVRTGGTFAAHALSNHPQIYCDRGETLHHLSAWRQAGIGVHAILDTIWNQDGYHAAGFRAIYRQAFHAEVWPHIANVRPRIIYLVRRNVTRQGISFGYQQLVRQGAIPFHPVHSFEARDPDPVQVDPAVIVAYARKVRREMEQAEERIGHYRGDLLTVAYEDMVGDGEASAMDPGVAGQIEDFLGVRRFPLFVDLRRDFGRPMAAWFTNWEAIARALQKAGFGGLDG